MGDISGHPSALKEKEVASLVATVNPARLGLAALDVVAHGHIEVAATDAAEAGSTTTNIVATAHVARLGDILRFTSGTASGYEARVTTVATNSITLGQILPSAPAAADTFEILRHRHPALDASGNLKVNIAAGSSSGTEYTEDAAAAADPAGSAMIMVRKDVPAATVSTDGDNIALRGSNYGAAYVTLVDNAGAFLSVGGGTQYTEDVAAAADPVGNAINLIRKDVPAAVASTDGDNVALRGSNYGAAYVTLVDNAGAFLSVGGGTQYTEDVAAAADPVGNALNLIRADTPGAVTTTDGDNVAARGTNKGELYVKHIDTIPVTQSGTWNVTNVSGTVSLPTGASTAALQTTGNTSLGTIAGAVAGTEMQVDVITMPTVTVNAHAVTNAGTFVVQENGAALTSLQLIDDAIYAEDTASANLDKGMLILARRTAAPANTSGTDLDYESLQMSAGRLWTSATIDAALPTGANVIGALTANQSVNVAQINGVAATMGNGVSGTGVQRVTLASDSTGQVVLAAGAATIGALTANQSVNVAQMNGVATSMGNGVSGTGVQRVVIASDNTANSNPFLVTQQARTSGGATPAMYISAASTNATSVKGSAGQIYMLTASNINAAVRYLKIYNKASAPTVGTDTPLLVFAIPGNTAGAGTNIPIPDCGLAFSTGIAFAITTGVATSDTGAVAANELVVNIGYL